MFSPCNAGWRDFATFLFDSTVCFAYIYMTQTSQTCKLVIKGSLSLECPNTYQDLRQLKKPYLCISMMIFLSRRNCKKVNDSYASVYLTIMSTILNLGFNYWSSATGNHFPFIILIIKNMKDINKQIGNVIRNSLDSTYD